MDDNFWTATDRETERSRIEALAERFLEKWPSDSTVPHGYARRVRRGWHGIGARLAAIQQEYDASPECYRQDLQQRALLALWPMLLPYQWKRRTTLSRRRVKKLRERITPALLAFSMMAVKTAPSNAMFQVPLLTVRLRKDSQRLAQSVGMERRWTNDSANEEIGRAVIQEYRSHPLVRRKLESALVEVEASLNAQNGRKFSLHTITAKYRAYRKAAFERGYADSRAMDCALGGEPWPTDQIWLEDFPPVN